MLPSVLLLRHNSGVRGLNGYIREWIKYPCSLNTVKQSLKKMGYVIKTMSHKPFLTAEHKAARLQLADYFEGFSPDQLSRIVWCDEKIFRCGSH